MSDAGATPWHEVRESRTPRPDEAEVALSRRQLVLLAVASAALVVGIAGVAAPGPFADLDLSGAFVFGAAIVALFQASRLGYHRLLRGERAAWLPAVETRSDVGRPGADLDDHLQDATSARTSRSLKGDRVSQGHHSRKLVRNRLAAVAERAVMHRDRVDRETATAAVERGVWTDDASAATLLRSDRADDEGDASARADAAARTAADRPGAEAPPALGTNGGDADLQDVTACPAVGDDAPSSFGDRVSALVGRGGDFKAAVRRGTASLAAGIPALEAGELAVARPPGEAAGTEWAEGVWETEHWRGVGALGLLTLAIAVLGESSSIGLVATVFVAYAGYAWLFDPPAVDLAVERTFEPADPIPGDHVTVTVRITNEGEAALTDCRLVDGVPDRLSVVDGCARHATAVAPGRSTEFSYEVLAIAGEHTFDRLSVAVRDASGARERTTAVETAPATLTCEPAPVVGSVPLHPQASRMVGRVPADVGGSGTAFRSVREYRRGDPLKRIDWNRKARTGELGTLEFDEEHAATVVVLVDVRPEAALAPGPARLSAVDRGLGGASQLLDTLLADGDRVGVGTLGLDWEYRSPGSGSTDRAAMQAFLERKDAAAATATGYSFNPTRYRRKLARRLPGDAQLVLFTPVCDEVPVDLARWFHARGHSVTVFSPDPTGSGTVGGTLAAVDRTINLSALRSAGVRVVDWAADESLERAVERAQGVWAA
jgi:uncharacterized protein (DUF58 family)